MPTFTYMIVRFRRGLTYGGIRYGWNEKALWRLPGLIGSRLYPIRKLNEIKIGNKTGYRLGTDQRRLSLKQLEFLTKNIDYDYEKTTDSDTPFE